MDIMDSAPPESQDMLDILAFECSKLTNKLWFSNSVDEKRSIIAEYLTNADKTGQPIADFKEGEKLQSFKILPFGIVFI